MIIVTVTAKVKPEFREIFLELIAKLSLVVRKEDGCIQYQQNISASEPNILFLYEQWQSEEHLQTHLEAAHMKQYFAEVSDWFDSVDMKTFKATEFTLGE